MNSEQQQAQSSDSPRNYLKIIFRCAIILISLIILLFLSTCFISLSRKITWLGAFCVFYAEVKL